MAPSGRKFLMPVGVLILTALIQVVFSDKYIRQPGYSFYKQTQKTSQHNTFEITFKTIDATGMLLHAQSVEKSDFLTIELVRGKIRYAGEFGNGVINIDKQVKGYHQLYVGQDLADNQWHTVKVTQNIQDITIMIDGKREPKYFGFRRAPPAPTDFSVEEVYIGGLYSFVGVSQEQSVSQEGTAMCVRSAYMNGINLLDNSAGTNVQNFCPTINYYPVFFPNKVSHMAWKDYSAPSLKLKFDFRTVIPEQVVVNYTNTFKKPLELTVNREGRLVLGLTVEKTGSHLIMKTAKPELYDGKWHTVEFYISNKGPNYDAEFTVDGIKRRSRLMNQYIFNGGPLHFGFGFTGCMKNMILNDRVIDYTNLQKVAVIMGKCNLKDFCTPNPCINGGKCNQTDTIFRCDCRHTAYTGSCCSQSRFNYTCSEVHEKAGKRFKSDKYWLDMDGIGGLPPIRAFCMMGRNPEETITQINTTIAYDINVINPSGRKIIPVTYLADEESLRELRLHFSTCRQFIRYRCARSALFKSPAGPKQVQWMGFDDKLHYYWGGSGGRRGYCACGITRTCSNPDMNCNCDSERNVLNLEDRGYLTIKEHLPVRRIDYFDVKSDTGKVGISTIGPLQCWGTGSDSLAATFRETFSFLQIGVSHRNDWNNNIDAGDVAFEFLTTKAFGVMVFAKGPFSGDFLQIKLIGRTRARATMNLGYYKNMNLDVDIAELQRTFDDNLPHKLRLDWNRREMNLTVDNITRIVEFHFQYGITHLDIDGTPFYVGGRNDGLDEGFMGIIRSMYYGGKLVNLPMEAEGLSSIGVYPGQGAACKLVKSPCNQGFCIDEYNKYKCNCSVSAFRGTNCQLDQNALIFSRSEMSVVYTFQNQVDVQEGYLNVAFKTSLADAVIFQLHGKNNAHITLMLVKSTLRLLFNFMPEETDVQSMTIQNPTALGKFNDNKRHIIRVHHKLNQLFTYVLDDNNKPIKQTRNISLPFTTRVFPQPNKLYLAKLGPLTVGTATTFIGCITGLKYQYLPVKAQVGVNIDLLQLQRLRNGPVQTSSLAPINGSCGSMLPLPPPLPTITTPPQFKFRNPVVTVAPIGENFSFNKIAVVATIVVLTIVAVILLFITAHCIGKYQEVYKAKEDKLALMLNAEQMSKSQAPREQQTVVERPEMKMDPVEYRNDDRHKPQQNYTQDRQPVAIQPAYNAPSVSYAPSKQPAAAASSPKDEDDGDWFL